MAKAKGEAPHTADTRAKDGYRGFAGLPRYVLASDAYRDLSMIGRAILIDVVARMKGDNNGSLHISYAGLAHALNRKNQSPIGPAIAELMDTRRATTCRSPAVKGKRVRRLHGGKSPGAPKGTANGASKHGWPTRP